MRTTHRRKVDRPNKSCPTLDSLSRIAQDMKREAAEEPSRQIRHVLPDGLYFVVRFLQDRWRFTFWRDGQAPTDAELESCRLAFGVPPDALASPLTTIGDKHCYFFTWPGPRLDLTSEPPTLWSQSEEERCQG